MAAVSELAVTSDVQTACWALGVPRASYYRHLSPPVQRRSEGTRRRPPAWALSPAERDKVLEVLHSPRFVDKAPAEVYATLLDEGTYLCSERTMYRILRSVGEVRERRNQLRRPPAAKPELVAKAPNQVWSWDITKLKSTDKRAFYCLYVVLDIFSRYVVGWCVVPREDATVARELVEACCDRHGITPDQLTLHADLGAAMTSRTMAECMIDLGIVRSHSRPHVSNDNPYSEAGFKTFKYRPDYPGRFGPIEEARAYFHDLFAWYNHEHRHLGIGLLTPADMHFGRASEVTAKRARVLAAAYAEHPERFRRQPVPPTVPTEAWINQPDPSLLPVGSATLN